MGGRGHSKSPLLAEENQTRGTKMRVKTLRPSKSRSNSHHWQPIQPQLWCLWPSTWDSGLSQDLLYVISKMMSPFPTQQYNSLERTNSDRLHFKCSPLPSCVKEMEENEQQCKAGAHQWSYNGITTLHSKSKSWYNKYFNISILMHQTKTNSKEQQQVRTIWLQIYRATFFHSWDVVNSDNIQQWTR